MLDGRFPSPEAKRPLKVATDAEIIKKIFWLRWMKYLGN
jgi:hypothetical protein